MEQVHSLRQQAERAERLAKGGFDALTCERLLAASREYRQRAFEIEVGTGQSITH